MELRTERPADEIAGVLSCYDRILIQGTLPGLCYAAGMTAYLKARQIRIFDYAQFAQPQRDALRENAERLAAEHRATETVCLVSSDFAVRGTSGQEVQKRTSRTFLADLESPQQTESGPSRLADRVDEETRKRLEELRRGQGSG